MRFHSLVILLLGIPFLLRAQQYPRILINQVGYEESRAKRAIIQTNTRTNIAQFQLINDTGYPIYPESVVVRADKKDGLSPCLKKLVPIIQQSQVDYVASPGTANDLIIKANDAYKGFPYSKDQAAFSVEQQVKLKIVSNGDNATLGDFETARVQKVIDIVVPIYKGQRKDVKAALVPADLVTNEFIDPTIGLK